MANPEHVALVISGAWAVTRWRSNNPGVRFDLSGAELSCCIDLSPQDVPADLSDADLSGAWLDEANFLEANLSRADLSKAKLRGANLTYTFLHEANLSEALLDEANLFGTDLRGANLTNAYLSRAKFTGAEFSQANLSEALLDNTVLSMCDLSECIRLEAVKHAAHSSVGVDTLIASCRGAGNKLTPELETFFRRAGVPKELLDQLPRIVSEIVYNNCFINYGEPDREFAEKLAKDLEVKGVSCWLYSMDATPGERTWREIGQKRREADKMIALCSAPSLVRDGVLKEIEEQIDEDSDRIVPVSLDDLWKASGFRVMRSTRDLKPFLRDRNYADFSDPLKYEQSLELLLKGLRR